MCSICNRTLYVLHIRIYFWYIINPRRAHALARVTVVGLSVCLSGLNLLLHLSRATRYYMYVFFTMNARFNVWSSIKTHGLKEIPFTAILGRLCGDGEHKQVDFR